MKFFHCYRCDWAEPADPTRPQDQFRGTFQVNRVETGLLNRPSRHVRPMTLHHQGATFTHRLGGPLAIFSPGAV